MNRIIAVVLMLLVIGCAAPEKKTEPPVEPVKEPSKKIATTVTQEDLDKLKSNIESIEAEDLDAFSE